ncbi:hypothetical protein SAMN05421788_103406 [Filimonas lacunae]|uniref:Uncharacterized protein n=1 Tax=Filimonas lacunae TaxID=477680 RepID=A0A1N7PDW4_9BACT|nr:hypothetical protein SAMN05421788_103406 [Filimonas lacunae]
MGSNQIKLLLDLAKQIESEPRKKAEIVETLTAAKILTPKGKFTSHYSNLRKVVATPK